MTMTNPTVYKGTDIPRTATAVSLAAKQYHVVRLTSAGLIEACDTAGELVFGILQDAPVASKVGMVRIDGTSRAAIGDTVTAGQLLKVEVTTGDLIPVSATSVTTGGTVLSASNIVCQALDSGADGDIIGVKMMIGAIAPTTAV
jgi:hypothetical protein